MARTETHQLNKNTIIESTKVLLNKRMKIETILITNQENQIEITMQKNNHHYTNNKKMN